MTEATRRNRWPVKRIHRWTSVSVGFIVFIWVVSGLAILLSGEGPPALPLLQVDYTALTISPAQAATTASAARNGARTTGMLLRRLNGRIIYGVSTRSGLVLVDAATGAVVTITAELATAIALEGLAPGTQVTSVERVEQPPVGYGGALPAYRIEIADGHRAWVVESNGDLQRLRFGSRLAGFIASFHTFRPLAGLPLGDRSRRPLLWLTSFLAIAVTLTGYWISLPRRTRSPDA